jgi:hypothetical protein
LVVSGIHFRQGNQNPSPLAQSDFEAQILGKLALDMELAELVGRGPGQRSAPVDQDYGNVTYLALVPLSQHLAGKTHPATSVPDVNRKVDDRSLVLICQLPGP